MLRLFCGNHADWWLNPTEGSLVYQGISKWFVWRDGPRYIKLHRETETHYGYDQSIHQGQSHLPADLFRSPWRPPMDADLTCNLLQREFNDLHSEYQKKTLVAESEDVALTGTDMTSNFSQNAEMTPVVTGLKTPNLPQLQKSSVLGVKKANKPYMDLSDMESQNPLFNWCFPHQNCNSHYHCEHRAMCKPQLYLL